jgi:hypothetical protein
MRGDALSASIRMANRRRRFSSAMFSLSDGLCGIQVQLMTHPGAAMRNGT